MLKFDVWDYYGNSSVIRGILEHDTGQPPKLQILRNDQQSAEMQLSLPQDIQSLGFSLKDQNKNWEEINYFEVLEHSGSSKEQKMHVKLNRSLNPGAKLRIQTKTSENKLCRVILWL